METKAMAAVSANLEQLALRFELERYLRSAGGNVHGAGTDLTSGVMDVSFEMDGIGYRLDLRRVERNDRTGT